jgi:hypothetical protein
LTLLPPAVPLGGSARLSWEMVGSAGRVRTLTVTLEGREEAEYRRGTRTETARSRFYRIELAREQGRAAIRAGGLTVKLPAGSMHSLKARHNKIIWSLKVTGEISRWPDVAEEFPFEVLPAEDRS